MRTRLAVGVAAVVVLSGLLSACATSAGDHPSASQPSVSASAGGTVSAGLIPVPVGSAFPTSPAEASSSTSPAEKFHTIAGAMSTSGASLMVSSVTASVGTLEAFLHTSIGPDADVQGVLTMSVGHFDGSSLSHPKGVPTRSGTVLLTVAIPSQGNPVALLRLSNHKLDLGKLGPVTTTTTS